MALSKAVMSVFGKYLEQLYMNPIRTKAFSSACIAVCGNVASQYLAGNQILNQDSIMAFGLFGLLFGGTIPHYFYSILERLVSDEVGHSIAKKLLIERLLYAPAYQAFAIYMLTILEGRSHEVSLKHLQKTFWPILRANWKWLTLVQIINFGVIPPVLRVLFMNLVGFFWSIYMAHTLRKRQEKRNN